MYLHVVDLIDISPASRRAMKPVGVGAQIIRISGFFG
jgi:hypothetical protein